MRAVAVMVVILGAAGAITPVVAQGQGVLMGIVTDTAGHPVTGTLMIDSTTGALSDRSGAYIFDVAPGTYVLTVKALGFEDYTSPEIVVSVEDTTVYHVELVLAPPLDRPVWLGCSLATLPEEAVCLNPVRADAKRLRVGEPGQWVFHTRAEWDTFWRRHLPPHTGGDPAAPEINWKASLLVAVGRGRSSGCENWRRYVNRVLVYHGKTVVVVGPDHAAGELTCAAVISPVDVVILPRGYGTVEFRELAPTDS